jgi:hypothetical protein
VLICTSLGFASSCRATYRPTLLFRQAASVHWSRWLISYPSSSPTEHSGTEQRAEKPWDSILKSSTHHADSGEDEAAKADDCSRKDGESFEGSHQRLRAGEVHRSLGMGNACEGERNKRWPHHTRYMK